MGSHHHPDLTKSDQKTVDAFHHLYYNAGRQNKTWKQTFFLGYQTFKYPQDLWICQEILYETKPDIIIECGSLIGGSALFMAVICDALNKGEIITVDIADRGTQAQHPRITYLRGSSTSEAVLTQIRQKISPTDRVMVILDSDHRAEHVTNELKLYAPLVSKGCYLVVEDTLANGHPVFPDHGPGPMEALENFLKTTSLSFKRDRQKEKFWVTSNPGGYLIRT